MTPHSSVWKTGIYYSSLETCDLDLWDGPLPLAWLFK